MDDDLTWDSQLVMGLVYTLIYGAMITMIVLVEIPPENAQTVNVLAGAMTIIQTTIVQYFFGATKSADASKAKTDTALRDIATQIEPVAVAAAVAKHAGGGEIAGEEGGGSKITVEGELVKGTVNVDKTNATN